MNRFRILLKKEFIYGVIPQKIMVYAFAIGYGLMFGFTSRLSEKTFSIILNMMPLVIAFSGTVQVMQSITDDKRLRTGEMVLTTGIRIGEYILTKLLSCIIHILIAVSLFVVVFLSASAKIGNGAVGVEFVFTQILMCLVLSIFSCCISILLRLTKPVHKVIIAVFLLVVAVLAVMSFINSVVMIKLLSGANAIFIWLALLAYGVVCLLVGIKFLAVRDFVAK